MTGADRPDARRERLLGIDLGERRIGIAVGDRTTRTAAPFVTIGRSKTVAADAAAIVRIASEQGAGALIVGLPLDMDGSEGAQAARTRDWAEGLARETGLSIEFRDERLTSERAERRIGGPPRGRNGGPPTAAQRDAHRARIDREAAALILQDALDVGAPGAAAFGPAAFGAAAAFGAEPTDDSQHEMTMPGRPDEPELRAADSPAMRGQPRTGDDRPERDAGEVETR